MKVIFSGILLFLELVVIVVFIGLVGIVAAEILYFISEHFH